LLFVRWDLFCWSVPIGSAASYAESMKGFVIFRLKFILDLQVLNRDIACTTVWRSQSRARHEGIKHDGVPVSCAVGRWYSMPGAGKFC